jgi:hypothetical protein
MYCARNNFRKMSEENEMPVEAIKEKPEEFEPDVEDKSILSMTLEDKVLDFINKHPEGVKILDMEESLCVKRMKLGFVAEQLHNDGKVLKIETTYFPKTSKKI